MSNDNPVTAQYWADALPFGNELPLVPVQSRHRFGSSGWAVDLTPFAFDGATQVFEYDVANIEMCNFAGNRADWTPYSSPSAGAAVAAVVTNYGPGFQVALWLVHEALGFLSRGATVSVKVTAYDHLLGYRRPICDTQVQIPAGYAKDVLAALSAAGWAAAEPPTTSVFHAGALRKILAADAAALSFDETAMIVAVQPARFSWV